MAEEARQPAAGDSSTSTKKEAAAAKPSKPQKGFFARVWGAVFGSGSEDYEKKLQYLSKEEASVHARLKRRAHSSRKKARNIIVVSVVLEVMAVAYAVMTTRSANLEWQKRALRVLPMFNIPFMSALAYSALVRWTKMLDRKDQKTLERLRAERQAKIDELKERTNYYTTQQLIQRYDLDPAAKAAAATVLASKLGADSGLKVYLADEANPRPTLGRSSDVELMKSTGLRNRKPAHIRSNSTGNAALTQFIDETSIEYSEDGQETPRSDHKVVEHYKGPSTNDGGWLARIAALLVGEDPTQCYALICGSCHMHNGLARKEDFPYITYYCPHCHALNGSQQSGDPAAGLTSGQATPGAAGEGSNAGSVRSGAGSSNLPTVQELPTGDENETDAKEEEDTAPAS